VHNEELHVMPFTEYYCDQIKRMRWVGHVARIGEMYNACKIVGQPKQKKPLGRRTRRWEDNIKMYLKEV